jgi:hypothetical protein
MKTSDRRLASETIPFRSSSLAKITVEALLNIPRDTEKAVIWGVALPALVEMLIRKALDLRVVTTNEFG